MGIVSIFQIQLNGQLELQWWWISWATHVADLLENSPKLLAPNKKSLLFDIFDTHISNAYYFMNNKMIIESYIKQQRNFVRMSRQAYGG